MLQERREYPASSYRIHIDRQRNIPSHSSSKTLTEHHSQSVSASVSGKFCFAVTNDEWESVSGQSGDDLYLSL